MNARKRRPFAIHAATGALVAVLGLTLVARAQEPAINPKINIDQDELLQGSIPVYKLLESGRHLFSTPFTPADGFGEGPTGPRLRKGGLYPEPRLGFRFLRLNGLDSQSCFECHNSIGSERLADTTSMALGRKLAGNAGPAGFASNAYINPDFPSRLIKFIRNPPHVFGTGYAQKLAEEISFDLLQAKYVALFEAWRDPFQTKSARLVSRRIAPSDPMGERGELDYGVYKVTYRPRPRPAVGAESRGTNERSAPAGALRSIALLHHRNDGESSAAIVSRTLPVNLPPDDAAKVITFVREHFTDFEQDYSGVIGVSEDLVVRPFQWKGIASNERNFVKDAMNFHFGMQPVENFFDVKTDAQGNKSVVITDHDQDEDDVHDEVSVGNVSALTIFTMTVRPPAQQWPADPTTAMRGRNLFLGLAEPSGFGPDVACVKCHKASLVIDDPYVEVHNPLDPNLVDRLVDNKVGLSAQRASSADLPTIRAFERIGRSAEETFAPRADRPDGAPEMREIRKFINDAFAKTRTERTEHLRKQAEAQFLPRTRAAAESVAPTGYVFHLTTFVPKDATSAEFGKLSYMCPRLPEQDGKIEVPLFTDFKRHHMGSILSDLAAQETDVKGIQVPADQFLTRPLWGVADTGPWLHDGRALTLREAILLHRGSGGTDEKGRNYPPSEANDTVEAFLKLSASDQDALVDFVLVLRLPNEAPPRDRDPGDPLCEAVTPAAK